MKFKISRYLKSTMTCAGLALYVVGVQAQDLTVGVVLATSGPGSAVGVPTRNAIGQWPTAISGHKIKLLIQDDRSDPSAATSIVRRMVSDDKVDIIVGGSLTPSSLSIAAVANETETPFLALAPTVLNDKIQTWAFNLPTSTALMASAVFDNMGKAGVKSVGFIGFSDVWGDQWLGELKSFAARGAVKLSGEERFGRGDTSVSGQVLRLISEKPDAILVGGTSSAAGLVQKTLRENGFKGKVYHTHGAVTKDFLRIAAGDGDGAIAPAGPSAVAEELPTSNLSRVAGLAFVTGYEAKFGAGTRTPFGAHAYDAGIVMEKAIPIALQKGQPGTKEFRLALKQAIESLRELPVSQGVINYSATNHYGMDERARVMVVVQNGAWKLLR